MRIMRLLACGCCLLMLAACRNPDPSVDLLEGELRWLEDQLYMMEDELQAKCRELADYRRSVSVSGDTPGVPSPAVGFSGDDEEDRPPRPFRSSEPTPAEPRNLPETAPEFEPPTIELPPSSPDVPALPDELDAPSAVPTYEPPPSEPQADTEFRGIRPRLEARPGPSEGAEETDESGLQLQSFTPPVQNSSASPPTPLDADVTHIVLAAHLASPHGFRDLESDPDLRILIEPRNAAGQPVALAGPVAVVVLDGNQSGPDARVARWDFAAADTRRRLNLSDAGPGIHLELRWPEVPPQSDDLHVFVRYETIDGRRLEADQKLDRESRKPTSQWKVIEEPPQFPEPKSWTILPAEDTPHQELPQGDLRQEDPTAEGWTIVTDNAEVPRGQWIIIQEPVPSEDQLSPADIVNEAARRPVWRPYR